MIGGYFDGQKNPLKVREFASVPFRPRFAQDGKKGYEKFSLSAILRSQDDGAFELSRGVSVAVVIEKTTPGDLCLGSEGGPHQAFVRVDDVALEFIARPQSPAVSPGATFAARGPANRPKFESSGALGEALWRTSDTL